MSLLDVVASAVVCLYGWVAVVSLCQTRSFPLITVRLYDSSVEEM